MSPNVLREEVINVLKGVLIHQRPRWAVLLKHQRQYEAWWKAEFAAALESWAWSLDAGPKNNKDIKAGIDGEYGVYTEERLPALSGRADLLVAEWPYALESTKPRVWIELKTRGTWWGAAAKGLGKHNQGLLHDMEKIKGVFAKEGFSNSDTVLLCHLLSFDSRGDEPLPDDWTESLELHPGFNATTFRIGYPSLVQPADKKGPPVPGTLWLRMDIYQSKQSNDPPAG